MKKPILVINAGSSSIKFSVFETSGAGALVLGAHGQVAGTGTEPRLEVADAQGRKLAAPKVGGNDHAAAIAAINGWFAGHTGGEAGFAAVGHRVVHGGSEFSRPVLIDERVIAALEALVPLAPLHQPHHIAAIRAVAAAAPKVPQIACFDTAFHHSQPPLARQFALPRALTAKGIRRYGFHGLSYEYIVSALPQVAPECAGGKLVVAHLGNGASLCAIEGGHSIATTMGFTPVDGLVMGTRTGLLDPGVIPYLMQHEGMNTAAIQKLIYEQSGLLGVSGLSSDMRELLASDRAEAEGSCRSTSSIASHASWARLPPRLAGSTRSSLPEGSARTPPRSAPGSAAMRHGSGSHSTRLRMTRPVPASRRPARMPRLG